MNSDATATQSEQTSVVGHHGDFSQPSVTVAANSAGDPCFLQSTGHQMPPTPPLRHKKIGGGSGSSDGGGIMIGNSAAGALLAGNSSTNNSYNSKTDSSQSEDDYARNKYNKSVSNTVEREETIRIVTTENQILKRKIETLECENAKLKEKIICQKAKNRENIDKIVNAVYSGIKIPKLTD